MPEGDVIAWFSSLSLYRKVFVAFFTVVVVLPIVTLTILQLMESLRGLRRRSGDEDIDDGA